MYLEDCVYAGLLFRWVSLRCFDIVPTSYHARIKKVLSEGVCRLDLCPYIFFLIFLTRSNLIDLFDILNEVVTICAFYNTGSGFYMVLGLIWIHYY